MTPASSGVNIHVGFAMKVGGITFSDWDFDGRVSTVSNEWFMAKWAVGHEQTRRIDRIGVSSSYPKRRHILVLGMKLLRLISMISSNT